ncbi:MAG: hypothetical protein CME33_05840 [Gimesia sp.]|uniref:caspase family protein n=1 Tax=Gimesia sp. TaxID=2024833 RepID=UPI000C3A7405|nr:caspase family protein [Gimesia sp.]MAX36069.1 hypothetical protein [Gimesia sp.]
MRAASADGSWQSEPARILFRYEKPLPKRKLYLVTVGINQYADPSLNLQFAVNDANAINKLFEIEGPKLYEQVNSTILLDKSATRSRIVSEIRKVANLAKAQDTVIVFLAGHSAVLGKQYFFLPHEFKNHSSLREENIREAGLLADSLGEELSRIPALKRILIFDTGRSKLKFNSTSRNPFALRSAVEKLVHANGGFTLAVATATDKSHEVSVLKQGVLTYSLLSGLHATNTGPLTNEWIKTSDKNNVADVLEWFSYANLHVPQLTRQYFGTEQNIHFSSAGYSFPVLPVLVSKNSHTKQQPSLQNTIEKPKKQKHRRITISPHSSNKNKLGNLHLVCIGINRYSDKTLNLQFARPDAEAIAQLFRNRGQHTFNKVIVNQLLDEQATRESILDTLKGLAKRVKPEDTFMFFVSSHGAMSGQRYFVIPHEFHTSAGRTLSEDLNNQGVAGDELGDLIRQIPAKQRVLIFDTCRSGGSLTFAKSRPDTFQIQGFFGKLESKAGSFTIAACSANQDAQENAELGHGVLTYALLAGLRGVKSGPLVDRAIAPNRIDGTVDILEWINYASGQVPRLMKQYYGREQFIKHSLRGTSFPVLQLAN